MKKIVLHSIYLFFLVLSSLAHSQNTMIKGYRIEGDDIIFSFDKRDYERFTPDSEHEMSDFEDFNIEEVIVSGQFNNWTRDKWNMTRIDENRFELRKKIADFTDKFAWEFKFLINNTYWAEPSENMGNIAPAKTPDGKYLNVYNLKVYTAYPNENGNARFKLKGFENAKKVVVSGTFNRWNEDLFTMNKVENGWELNLQLKPDEYQYRYIVDGKWMEDPHNPYKTPNEFGEYNSLINVKEYVTFKLRGYSDAAKVVLAGSFNNWNETDFEMEKTAYGWKGVVQLSGGKHHYKFIVDGEWITDPNNSVKEYDEDGHINSVCMVK